MGDGPDLETINGLGELFMGAERVDEALALFDICAERDEKNCSYANNRAVALFQLGRSTNAVRELERAMSLPGDRRLVILNYCAIAARYPRFARRALALCREYVASGGADENEQVASATAKLEQALVAVDAWVKSWVGGMPQHALRKVNGSTELANFLQMGENLSTNLLQHFEGLKSAETILDFGVGLGRVMWPLVQKIPTADFIGYDVDPLMINSVSKIREVADVRLLYSTRDIPDDSVDATFVISVFTHLDVTTDYWLGELQRILKPGGRAFVTYHDETLYRELVDKKSVREPNGRDFRGRITTGVGAQGSTFIASFYETPEWERTVGRFFRIVKTVPRGLIGHQSFSLVEKVERPNDVLSQQRTYIRDLEGELYKLRESAKLEF